MAETVKTVYGVRVSHLPESFEPDMDFSSENPAKARDHYLRVRDKYKDHQIRVTQTITRETAQELSESELEVLAHKS